MAYGHCYGVAVFWVAVGVVLGEASLASSSGPNPSDPEQAQIVAASIAASHSSSSSGGSSSVGSSTVNTAAPTTSTATDTTTDTSTTVSITTTQTSTTLTATSQTTTATTTRTTLTTTTVTSTSSSETATVTTSLTTSTSTTSWTNTTSTTTTTNTSISTSTTDTTAPTTVTNTSTTAPITVTNTSTSISSSTTDTSTITQTQTKTTTSLTSTKTVTPTSSTTTLTTTATSSTNTFSSSTLTATKTTTITTTSSTHTQTTSTTTTHICFEDDVAWFPLDMLGHNFSKEPDAFACQKRCQAVFGCVHFSFFKATLDCHLTNAAAIRHSSPAAGFLSGPFHCWGGIPNQDKYVKLGPKTYVPKELACMEVGKVYVPEMAPPRIFPPQRFEGDLMLGLNTIQKCRKLCSITLGCEHFSVHFPDGLCSLAAITAKPLSGIENTISGRRESGCMATIEPGTFLTDVALTPHIPVRPESAIIHTARTAAIAVPLVATAAALTAGFRFWGQRQRLPELHHEASMLLGDTDV